MQRGLTIAIDGYSSCGKSTLAKALAQRLGYLYIDSGAMYRALTWYLLHCKIPIADNPQLRKALEEFNPEIHPHTGGKMEIFWKGVPLDQEIRSMEVSSHVSEVSTIPVIRRHLVSRQRELAGQLGVVMDGRDIGTVVFPDAEVKLFLTADPAIRAQRRYLELKKQGLELSLEDVMENLVKRDHIDSTREDSPLRMADDAILIDNSNLTEAAQCELALSIIDKKRQVISDYGYPEI